MTAAADRPPTGSRGDLCGVRHPDYANPNHRHICTAPKGHGPLPHPEGSAPATYDHADAGSGVWWNHHTHQRDDLRERVEEVRDYYAGRLRRDSFSGDMSTSMRAVVLRLNRALGAAVPPPD